MLFRPLHPTSALLHPGPKDCLPGRVAELALMTDERSMLDVDMVDARDTGFVCGFPAGIDTMILIERHWHQSFSRARVYDAV